jgi:hypothetical protein
VTGGRAKTFVQNLFTNGPERVPRSRPGAGSNDLHAGTTTCWFNYKVTNGNVTITAPPADSGDGPAFLQAMLGHLLALTG